MDYKTRIKIVAIIGVIIVAVIFIFMIIFVKNNNGTGIPTKENARKKSSKWR